MKWRNIQIGEFEYDSKHIITFPEGLLGFEDLHKFILINDEQSDHSSGLFRWKMKR